MLRFEREGRGSPQSRAPRDCFALADLLISLLKRAKPEIKLACAKIAAARNKGEMITKSVFVTSYISLHSECIHWATASHFVDSSDELIEQLTSLDFTERRCCSSQ